MSLASGVEAFKALRNRGHDVLVIDTSRGLLSKSEEQEFLASRVQASPPSGLSISNRKNGASVVRHAQEQSIAGVDVFFLALHGGIGEDGSLQAAFDLTGVSYTGSGHMPSAYAMDKDISKRLFRESGISTPKWLMAPASESDIEEYLGLPVIVKSNKQGSSVGIEIIYEIGDVQEAVKRAFEHDDEVMIEQYVSGRELTVGVLDGSALAVGEIETVEAEFFDYQSKYQKGGAVETFPADLTPEKTAEIQELGLRAHNTLKLQHYSRTDFIMDTDGKVWCLEANTLPGMTPTSLMPQSAEAAGIPFDVLCETICRLGIARNKG